ncbi:hypothetical protein H6G17_16060 [Chroococcidiopsis sp. FACHB-1243]|nr:hypothetical protein [Chroococcidiopsis sp. [FACHB-1243]]MBD2307016.1 hypothetical protein [Chroococcidiopsis sp. [FACHB-1243]]
MASRSSLIRGFKISTIASILTPDFLTCGISRRTNGREKGARKPLP